MTQLHTTQDIKKGKAENQKLRSIFINKTSSFDNIAYVMVKRCAGLLFHLWAQLGDVVKMLVGEEEEWSQ